MCIDESVVGDSCVCASSLLVLYNAASVVRMVGVWCEMVGVWCRMVGVWLEWWDCGVEWWECG